MNNNDKTTSKFLSLILRHQPETIGLTLDENGWVNTDELLLKMNAHGHSLTLERLKTIVDNNDKKRFAFSEDLKRIRANQGHSIEIDLNLQEQTPPEILYHGTAERNIESIKQQGLEKGSRHHVHLSADTETARKVGMRYGKPVVLTVNAKSMYEQGYKFFQSENGVWLTDHVLPRYIRFNC
jgi:putative RNA 2'-phosphotransferase